MKRALVWLMLLGCVGCGDGGGGNPCSGDNPGIHFRLVESPTSGGCPPLSDLYTAFFLIMIMGQEQTEHRIPGPGTDYAFPWPTGTPSDVPASVWFDGCFIGTACPEVDHVIGQVDFVTAPAECLIVEIPYACHFTPDGGVDAGAPDAGP